MYISYISKFSAQHAVQLTAAHCSSLQLTVAHYSSLQLTAVHCNTLQHTRRIHTSENGGSISVMHTLPPCRVCVWFTLVDMNTNTHSVCVCFSLPPSHTHWHTLMSIHALLAPPCRVRVWVALVHMHAHTHTHTHTHTYTHTRHTCPHYEYMCITYMNDSHVQVASQMNKRPHKCLHMNIYITSMNISCMNICITSMNESRV